MQEPADFCVSFFTYSIFHNLGGIMLFSSITFLYYFLPIFFVLYFIAPAKLKNAVILFGSLFFYGCAGANYLILILVSILTGYLGGILIGRKKHGKLWLTVSVTILLSLLGYFKYAGFFLENLRAVTGLAVPVLHIALPIGISFYTFQIISYLVDVYRQDVSCQRNIIHFGAFVVLFPQLIAGPIVRYKDIAAALKERVHTAADMYEGVTRFLVGLSKKVLIANSMAQLGNIFRSSDEQSVVFYWIYAVSFMLLIYFDFSGYSDMAIGLGKIMGFSFPENFDHPYMAHSITDFWRRWHMTLGTWFRDYVYIPLGGNRTGRFRWLMNILLVWLLTGLWHGAEWNFVIWGLMFAALLIIEKLTGFTRRLPKSIAHIYVLLVLVPSFVIFNATDMTQAMGDLRGMLGLTGLPLITEETLYYLGSYALTFLIAILGCTPLPRYLFTKMQEKHDRITAVLQTIGLTLLLLLSTAYLVDGSFNPFLYFRF